MSICLVAIESKLLDLQKTTSKAHFRSWIPPQGGVVDASPARWRLQGWPETLDRAEVYIFKEKLPQMETLLFWIWWRAALIGYGPVWYSHLPGPSHFLRVTTDWTNNLWSSYQPSPPHHHPHPQADCCHYLPLHSLIFPLCPILLWLRPGPGHTYE